MRQRNNRMNTINEITATYQRIAEEGRSELNKSTKQDLPHRLTAIIVICCRNCGNYIFLVIRLDSINGDHCRYTSAFYPIDKVSQPAVSPERLSGKKIASMSKNFRR